MTDMSQQKCISIGRRTRDSPRTECAACTGGVLNDELLVKNFTHALRESACDDVSRTAGREGHDDHYRSGRKVLRANSSDQSPAKPQQNQYPLHRTFLSIFCSVDVAAAHIVAKASV